jgi:hypothetical protein
MDMTNDSFIGHWNFYCVVMSLIVCLIYYACSLGFSYLHGAGFEWG